MNQKSHMEFVRTLAWFESTSLLNVRRVEKEMCNHIPRSQRSRRFKMGLTAIVMCAGLVGCGGRINTHGDKLDSDRLAEVVAGQHTRDDVAAILGSPSTTSAFDGESWYYISNRTETLAFLAPEVTEQQVVVVKFNDVGIVTNIDTLGLDQGRDVEIVDRETPTVGNDISILDEFIGNIGRFGGGETDDRLPGQ